MIYSMYGIYHWSLIYRRHRWFQTKPGQMHELQVGRNCHRGCHTCHTPALDLHLDGFISKFIIIKMITTIMTGIMIKIMISIIITCCSSVPGPPTQAVPSIGVESVPQVNSASLKWFQNYENYLLRKPISKIVFLDRETFRESLKVKIVKIIFKKKPLTCLPIKLKIQNPNRKWNKKI